MKTTVADGSKISIKRGNGKVIRQGRYALMRWVRIGVCNDAGRPRHLRRMLWSASLFGSPPTVSSRHRAGDLARTRGAVAVADATRVSVSVSLDQAWHASLCGRSNNSNDRSRPAASPAPPVESGAGRRHLRLLGRGPTRTRSTGISGSLAPPPAVSPPPATGVKAMPRGPDGCLH